MSGYLQIASVSVGDWTAAGDRRSTKPTRSDRAAANTRRIDVRTLLTAHLMATAPRRWSLPNRLCIKPSACSMDAIASPGHRLVTIILPARQTNRGKARITWGKLPDFASAGLGGVKIRHRCPSCNGHPGGSGAYCLRPVRADRRHRLPNPPALLLGFMPSHARVRAAGRESGSLQQSLNDDVDLPTLTEVYS